jgi:hypothetical protein
MTGLVGVLWGTVAGLFPPSAPAAALAFGSIALVARRARPTIATMLLIRGAYVFLALLLVAVWFRPLSGAPLPDVTVLGPNEIVVEACGHVFDAEEWAAEQHGYQGSKNQD